MPTCFFFINTKLGSHAFAKEKDTNKIAAEINAYNEVCKKIAVQYGCTFLDITTAQKSESNDAEIIAADGLHPSALEYSRCAEMLADAMFECI